MNNDLLNILSNSNKDIDNQKLMDYLSGKLPEEQKHEVEKWMSENDFANEALEGLQDFKAKKDLQLYVDQLNKELNLYIQQKKKRRQRKKLKDDPQIYITIVIVLLLVVIAWLVINKLMK
jgi:ferric-dicitrate binding protein FerR (iron transport regulator)